MKADRHIESSTMFLHCVEGCGYVEHEELVIPPHTTSGGGVSPGSTDWICRHCRSTFVAPAEAGYEDAGVWQKSATGSGST